MPQAELTKLASLIEGITIAMLTTTEADGELRSRPMATQAMTPDGYLLFYTRRDAPKVDEAAHRPVNVAYADAKGNTYVSVSGSSVRDTDRAEIRAHWKPERAAWFPGGVEDPQIRPQLQARCRAPSCCPRAPPSAASR